MKARSLKNVRVVSFATKSLFRRRGPFVRENMRSRWSAKMNRREIERLLPAVFQRTCTDGTPLVALLEVMAALHDPAEKVLAELDMICDPIRTPDGFVPFLATWVDLERIFDPSLV